ncbi:MAG TPA: cytochrome d ubiquinol oxidase subunit II [Candidatus Obscuribacterales bacterium]
MPSLELILALAMLVSLTFYVLMGGADYGGGVWDLLATGPRAKAQRELIAEAIGPIWEANHVWLILVIVVLFTAFPAAFALITTVLHIPLTLMLIGIVLRGSAFTFRTYDSRQDDVQRRWGRVFSSASLVTPILLGITVGAISSGDIRSPAHDFMSVFVWPWLQPFPIAVGLLALVLFAFLAAVYLTLDTAEDAQLQDDFRRRALISWAVAAIVAVAVFFLARTEAPDLWHHLQQSWHLHVAAAVLAAAAVWTLFKRSYGIARVCAIGQVTFILWGWAAAQYPYLVRPDLTIFNAAGPHSTLTLLVMALCAGALLLFPSFWYLLTVFKTRHAASESDTK